MEEIEAFMEEYIANEDTYADCVTKLDNLMMLIEVIKGVSITDIYKVYYDVRKESYINLTSIDDLALDAYDAHYEAKMEEERNV